MPDAIVHDTITEIYQILEGEGVLVTGGTRPEEFGGKSMASTRSKGTPHTVYYKDGSVWATGWMDGKVPTGFWEYFRKDGTKMGSGTFENGEKVGEWTRYDAQGRVEKVTTFKKKPK